VGVGIQAIWIYRQAALYLRPSNRPSRRRPRPSPKPNAARVTSLPVTPGRSRQGPWPRAGRRCPAQPSKRGPPAKPNRTVCANASLTPQLLELKRLGKRTVRALRDGTAMCRGWFTGNGTGIDAADALWAGYAGGGSRARYAGTKQRKK